MSTLNVSNVYFELLDHLQRADVRYAILHGWQSLTEGEVSDLDLVVSLEDLNRAEAVLNARYRISNIFQYEACSFGFALLPVDRENRWPLLVDISTDYRCRGRIFFTAQELLQSRKKWRGYWVLGPKEELEYLLVKKIYEKGTVPVRQRTRIEQLATVLGQEKVSTSIIRHFGRRRGTQLMKWISDQAWDLIEGRIQMLQRSLRWQALKRDPFSAIRYWVDELCRIWTRWKYPTGVAVVTAIAQDDGDDKMLMEDLQTVPYAFRRVVVIESVFRGSSSLSELSLFKRIFRMLYCLVLQIRMRAFVVRSSLVIWKVNNLNLFAIPKRTSRLLGLLHGWAAEVSIVFRQASTNPAKHKLASLICPSAIRLHDPKLARAALEQHLCDRYAASRHVWFPQ